MFQWDKSLRNLDVPATQLLHLFRSMRDVQLALPGLPAQEAGAYLCQYRDGAAVGTAVALDLHKSGLLAIYVDTPREVAVDRADRMLDQALGFVESMGFLMSDLDIQLLSDADRITLWTSLPLQKGAEKADSSLPSAGTGSANTSAGGASPAAPADADASGQPQGGGVDDLLAAVEALRNNRPGLRARKKAVSAEDLKRRRAELRANLGRILASL